MAKVKETKDLTVEEKLKALFELQLVDSKIDDIKRLRGELPLEVQDLEDEIEGLQTRIQNYDEDLEKLNDSIVHKKNEIKEAQALIKKYSEQQNNVRNNREFDSLAKEIEYQTLEIELCEKRIKEYTAKIEEKNEVIKESRDILEDRENDLEAKKTELNSIVSETQKEEEELENKSVSIQEIIEDRLLNAYKKIRGNARNGLAVVTVQRDACGGCFNKIPPQRQLDVRSRKKIIVCEYCGRILVDPDMEEEFKQ
ncbi:MAG: C4-type zinc ribbon domain-containing protein [Bacteroidales bacterium]|jgi:predicted  nucleic acid-binding Zn-ribbon protein|nr:C4-type zinc ribbon domain-containing protein [Bacteroidales bacterium]